MLARILRALLAQPPHPADIMYATNEDIDKWL